MTLNQMTKFLLFMSFCLSQVLSQHLYSVEDEERGGNYNFDEDESPLSDYLTQLNDPTQLEYLLSESQLLRENQKNMLENGEKNVRNPYDLNVGKNIYKNKYFVKDVQNNGNLKREFGYRANDERFYLPNAAFSNHLKNKEVQEVNSAKEKEEEGVGANKIFMKKAQVGEESSEESTAFEPHPVPNHILSSGSHSVEYSNSIDAPQSSSPPLNLLYMGLIGVGGIVLVLSLVGGGICWYRLQQRVKATAEVDYPAYGVTGPSKDLSPSGSGGDRKLAQSAHMFHYQHQKQQMAALAEKGGERNANSSDIESEDENEEGDYTVYECPGLAPAGDMEVKNPLFNDEPTPATPQTVRGGDTTPTN